MGRQLIARWFASALDPDQLETATLLTSELATNAVLHGQGKITLRADLDHDRLLVEVIDEGEGEGLEHILRDRGIENLEGWGLKLVDRQANRWGTHKGTTHVWFELKPAEQMSRRANGYR
jgi:anti-sigma regulatory factor (Ser/Thr protein kinase)